MIESNLIKIAFDVKSPTIFTMAVGFVLIKISDWFRSRPRKEGKAVDINSANKKYSSDDFYSRFNFYAPPRLRKAITEFYVKRSTNTGTQEKFFKSISANLDVDNSGGVDS